MQRLVGLRCPFLHLDVGDAEGKGVRRNASLEEQRQDEAKFPVFVRLAKGGGIARGRQ